MATPAHTPRRLERLTQETLACLVIRRCIPPSIFTMPLPYDREHWILREHSIPMDKILMATNNCVPEYLPQKELLLTHLQAMREWWEGNVMAVGRAGVWRHVLECLACELDHLDQYCYFPLFKLLLQLLFSIRMGKTADRMPYNSHPFFQVELGKTFCPVFADVLGKLKPFRIEELSTQFIIFGSCEPLQVILENSPCLRKVSLRQNIMEEILICVSQNCPLVDTFVMEMPFDRLLVPVDCLYMTFFKGLRYSDVDALARTGSPASQQASLSFTRLKFVDLGKNSDCPTNVTRGSFSEFIYNLLFFYPTLESVSCQRLKPFVPKPPSRLPSHLQSLSYSLRHLDLEGVKIWVQDGANEAPTNRVLSTFSKAQHFTFSHDPDTHLEVANFAKTWIPKFRVRGLTINTYFVLPQEKTWNFLSPYCLLLGAVGSKLTVLRLNLHTEVCVNDVYSLISLCSFLELLGIVVSTDFSEGNKTPCSIQKLLHLSCLIVEGVDPLSHIQQNLFNNLVQDVIMAAPGLQQLELVVHHRPLMWLMTLAQKKLLANLQDLVLNLGRHGLTTVGVSFYVQFLELLPKLKVFTLGPVCSELFKDLKIMYCTTDLQLVTRETVSDQRVVSFTLPSFDQ